MATKQSMIQAKYDAKNSKVYSLKFNRKTDAEIIEKLDNVESRNGYIKQLIREDIKRTGSAPKTETEEENMTSKEFYKGSLVSSTALENMIADTIESGTSAEEFDRITSEYRQFMIEQMEQLDDRLWWEPETGTVYYQDDRTDKPLPSGFEKWWEETTEKWFART